MKRDTVTLINRSRKIPVRVESVTVPYLNAGNTTLAIKKSFVVYGYELDEGQRKMLEHVRELVAQLRIRLKTTGLTRESVVEMVSRKLRGALAKTPTLIPGYESNAFFGKVHSNGTPLTVSQ